MAPISGLTLAQSATAIHFDAILARVAAGEQLTSVLRSRSDYPSKSGFDAYLRRNPDLRARLDAARPLSGQTLVRAKFDEILLAIRNGATAEGAVESFGGTGASFFKVVKADSGLKTKYIAATAKREVGENAIGKSAAGRWSEDDFDKALEALRSAPKLGMRCVLGAALPALTVVLEKARRDAAFRDRLTEIVGDRAKRRAAMKRQPPRQYATGLLRRACLALDIFRLADSTVGRFDPADRDDAISEIILSVLDGKMDVAEIKTKGRRFAYRRVFADAHRLASLDAPVFDSSDVKTAIETIANPDPILFY